jgi:hypothetical protein
VVLTNESYSRISPLEENMWRWAEKTENYRYQEKAAIVESEGRKRFFARL